MMNRRFDLYGGNSLAFMSKEPEILIAGGAGSGKSLAALVKILTVCDRYPGARCLIVRKTRESLTESVLVTWEQKILGHNHPILTRNPTLRRVRQSYRIGNGSEVVCGGMDKADRILSSEWDMIYVNEVNEITLNDWEILGGRLRAGRVSFQQLMADVNPTSPASWMFKRQANGLMKMYTSTLRDNPFFFNREERKWTRDGERYYARLQRMTGARRARFLEGKWVAAEGVVYDFKAVPEFDDNGQCIHPGHMLPESWTPPAEWPRVWGIDWGKTSPTVLGLCAVDDDGRLYHYREVYQTRMRPDELGKWAKREIETGREKKPLAIVCDHDEERKVDFEKASGLNLELADKRDRDKGIEAMQSRFDLDEDGKPRIFFKPDCRETLRGKEPDSWLVDEGLPTSCLEEIVGYTWCEDYLKDTPIEENDHAMDCARYICRFADNWFQTRRHNWHASSPKTTAVEHLPAGTFRR